MSSPDLQTVVIACPNCGTRYQVPYATIGTAGREVQCAHCSAPWHAAPDAPDPGAFENDLLFSQVEESVLDEFFEAEARVAALPTALPDEGERTRTMADIRASATPAPRSPGGSVDAALLRQSRRAFHRRQARIKGLMPAARIRRTARIGALVALVALLGLGFGLRTEIVRALPALAGVYEAIGLPVNVVGLEFAQSRTLTSFRDGRAVMLITSQIRSVAHGTIAVPPVLVSLVDGNGATVYEWTVTPQVAELTAGDSMEFSTEVSAPPQGAVTVRLSFGNLRSGTTAAVSAGTI